MMLLTTTFLTMVIAARRAVALNSARSLAVQFAAAAGIRQSL